MKTCVYMFLLLGASCFGQQINQDIIPANSGLNLGRSNQVWNAFLNNVTVAGTCVNQFGQSCFGNGNSVNTGTASTFAVYSNTNTISPSTTLDDSLTAPATITSQEPVAAPQFFAVGTGGLSLLSVGGILPTPGASTGGIGITTGAVPQININNGGWTNIAGFTSFSNSTPSAPSNGLNVQWQNSGNNISAAIVGDGNASHCLLGTMAFGSCTTSTGAALSQLTAATGTNTLANANNAQVWNWAQTTASQSAFTFGETSASTGAGSNELTLSTASGSLATPFNIAQGSITGTSSIPAQLVSTTLNNAGLSDILTKYTVVNTSSSGISGNFFSQYFGGAAGTTLQAQMDIGGSLYLNGVLTSIGGANSIQVCGGNSNTCVTSSNAQLGGGQFQGSDNSNSGSSTKAGYGIFRGGFLSNATPNAAALEGATQLGVGYLKGSAVAALGDVVCGTSTAFTVTDCSHTGPAVNIIGIATNTSNPIATAVDGTALVKTDGAVTIGDILCMGTVNDGQAHDNGTSACATAGTTIGVVIATSGTITQMSGTNTASTAMSTTLPLVQLHIGK